MRGETMTKNFKIKVLVMDVDGTLTDGGIYIGKEVIVTISIHAPTWGATVYGISYR